MPHKYDIRQTDTVDNVQHLFEMYFASVSMPSRYSSKKEPHIKRYYFKCKLDNFIFTVGHNTTSCFYQNYK